MKQSAVRKRPDTAPVLDVGEYPTRWRDYVGQEPAVKMLQVAAASARIRKQPLDHVLISHPTPGIGKTALACLVGVELKRPVRAVSGKITDGRARLIFSDMADRDVLFIDEAHQMGDASEWLLHYMQDGVLMGPRGPEVQPKVTIIAATTHPQKLPDAVIDRFMLVPPMSDYDTDEAGRIAQVMGARILGDLPKLTKAEATSLALAAGRNPRAIKKLLVALRDLTITKQLPLIKGRYNIPAVLEWQGITHDGLDPTMQRYLETLAVDFEGSAGAKALEDRLQQPGGLSQVERVLIDRGLLTMTRSGRVLTQAGLARYHELAG